jgi:15-cis-phytoene desaturase
MKIAIFGGGIGGLTVAHELSKFNNKYDITIYEKKNDIGGLARSMRNNDGCATEYCWRVIFGFYNNVKKIMSEIPLIENKSKTVLDNLTDYKHINLNDTPMTLRDHLLIMYNLLYGFTSCDERLKTLDNHTWWESLDYTSKSNLLREIGPWLGMDRYKGSYNSVIKVGMEMQILPSKINSNYTDHITTKPTNEAWFDHWKAHLISKNVNFKMNTELLNINIINNHIVSAQTNKNTIVADYYIFALPIEILSTLINKTPELNYGYLKQEKIQKLTDTCLHIQLSFQVYFNKMIELGNSKNAFLLTDSPWDLIILSYDQAYINTNICDLIPEVKGAWSVAVCTSYIPGIVFGKSFVDCSYEEIIIELWAQLSNSPKLRELIKTNNDFDLTDDLVIKWSNMWPTFYYQDNKLKTDEPKFTNNVGSLALRPSIKTHIDNLFISTAYTRETIDVFSMEAAAISGIYTANLINSNIDKPMMIDRPYSFWLMRKIDEILYCLNVPNIGPFLIISIITYLLYIIIIKLWQFI